MQNIRKQGIQGTLWVYVGFAIGALITYLFTNKYFFTTNEYGLTRSLLDIGMLVFAFSSLGTPFYLYKFFPYYKDNLEDKENDLLGLALKISVIGFAVTGVLLYLIEPIIFKKFSSNSPLLVEYFYLTIPIGFFYLVYNILEAYSYGFNKGVTTNFLKETVLRIYTLLIVVLKIFNIITLKLFFILFSFQNLIIIILLAAILYKENSLWINFKTSKLTRKFKKNIISVLSLTILSIIVNTLRGSLDTLMLSAKLTDGQEKVAIFGFVTYLVMIIHAPIRSLSGITIPILSRHWKEKNMVEITKIYKRSSINLLSFSLFIYFLVLLNFSSAIVFLELNTAYLLGKNVFIIVGIIVIIELGTGMSSQIIGTSTFYRFELWTSILLTALIIPLSYFLTVKYLLIGPALANLISFSIYNAIRYLFLLKKFKMQPFSIKTLEVLAIAAISFVITHYGFGNKQGLLYIILRSILFSALFVIPVYFRNISPDLKPVIETIKNRLKKTI